MRKTLIAIIAAAPLAALGATAFAAPSTTATNDDLFVKANSTVSAAEKVEPLKGVAIKSIRLDDDHGLKAEHGEAGEGMDD